MSGQMSPHDLNRITASAEQILKMNHGFMEAYALVREVVAACLKDVRPDIAASMVDHALEQAVRNKHLILKHNEYSLPPQPKPPVAYVAHGTKVANAARQQPTQARARQAAIKPAPAPAPVVNHPIVLPTGPMTVKLPPKPAPPPPTPPAPWRTDEYVMEPTFTEFPSAAHPMRQESLFDLTPRPKPARKPRTDAAPPVDGHEMRQAGFGLTFRTPRRTTGSDDDE